MIIVRLMGMHQLGLLPNIARTGIKDIDNPPKEDDNDPFAAIKKLKDLNKIQKKEAFHSYIAELKLPSTPEILDLDQYLSLGLKDPNPF